MPINLAKYNGRYVEIIYGSTRLRGKLINNALVEYYLGSDNLGSDTVYCLDKEPYNLNEQNIDAIRDITRNIYKNLCERINTLETNPTLRGNFFRKQLEQNRKIKAEVEEILRGK